MTDEPVKTWKNIAIRSLFGGVGFAMGAAAVVGVVVWYSDRPTPTPPWDTKSLKATFETMEYIGPSKDTYTLAFKYNVQNTTNKTYEVNTAALTPMAVLIEGKALSKTFSDDQSGNVTIDAPEFIPPASAGRMTVRVSYSFPQEFSDADKNDFEKVVAPLDKRLKELDSIVLFDGLNHYQIDLPSGWAILPGVKEGTKPEIDPSLLKKKTNATDVPPCPSNDPLGIIGKSCQPQAPKAGAPPCPLSDPVGLYAKSPCTPRPARE